MNKVSDSDIGKWLQNIADAALVRVYPAEDGERYLQLLDFRQQARATKSKFPHPLDACAAPAMHPLSGSGASAPVFGDGDGDGDGNTSEANASADKSAKELTRVELWSAGKSLLREAGMPENQCGSFVGKLVSDYGDETVIEAVRIAVVNRPADPAEYLKATCMRAKGERQSRRPSPFKTAKQRDTEDATEKVRRMTGGLLNGTPEDVIEMEAIDAARLEGR